MRHPLYSLIDSGLMHWEMHDSILFLFASFQKYWSSAFLACWSKSWQLFLEITKDLMSVTHLHMGVCGHSCGPAPGSSSGLHEQELSSYLIQKHPLRLPHIWGWKNTRPWHVTKTEWQPSPGPERLLREGWREGISGQQPPSYLGVNSRCWCACLHFKVHKLFRSGLAEGLWIMNRSLQMCQCSQTQRKAIRETKTDAQARVHFGLILEQGGLI